jgi:adenylate cyclase class 2
MEKMPHLNIEMKARVLDVSKIRYILAQKSAKFQGIDHQIDTYFKSPSGRLKLREGNIENHLIYYEREDKPGIKESKVTLADVTPGSGVKQVLEKVLGTLVVVDKTREIYWIDNVKFHIDNVVGLGSFVEIEAIDKDLTIGKEKLNEQCSSYLKLFEIPQEDMISCSYSDLLAE